MSTLSTHILDTALGKPASGVNVKLEAADGAGWKSLGAASTNADGRAKDFVSSALKPGTYRLTFEIEDYFHAQKRETFFPRAEIVFKITDDKAHYHVPLLISGFGYSTYRGS